MIDPNDGEGIPRVVLKRSHFFSSRSHLDTILTTFWERALY